ncbi:MAG: hypothetical protein HZA34_00795 [Candidatus Pacebacteria bacterium]|nr:hypothetical protein [Candidatus Paceibacterota bacterium]
MFTAQSFAVVGAILISYIWVRTPELAPYSLQLTAGLVLAYIMMKRVAKTHIFHIAPSSTTAEVGVFTTALFMLIGYTGGVTSIFLPLLYLLLFIGVLSLHTTTIILFEFCIPLYLWALGPVPMTQHQLATLLSFPILLPLLVFARKQYTTAQQEKKVEEKLADQTFSAALFLSTFLKPKLQHILELSNYPDHNKRGIQKQLSLTIEELDDVLKETE